MTDRRDPGPFEVPIGQLPIGRGQRRRAAVGVLTVVAVLGGAIGLARIADREPASSVRSATPQVAAAASALPSAAAPRSIVPRVERLLDLPDRVIEGAPPVTLLEGRGAEIDVVRWTAGTGPVPVATVPRALREDAGAVPVPAPRGGSLVLLTVGEGGDARGDRARLVDQHGTVRWSASDIAARSGALWSADGRIVVLAGIDRTWHLISIATDGRATDRLVDLPFDVFLPTPLPRGWLSIPQVDPRTVPLGFSGDGGWIYGGTFSRELGILIASFRVAVDGSTVEPIADLAVGRPDGLRPEPGAVGGRLVDPATGRIASFRVDPDTTGRQPTLQIRNPDEGLAFVVDQTTVLGSGWDGSGGLVILSADAPELPDRVVLDDRGRDGTPGTPIVTTGPVAGAGLIGVRDGFAALIVVVSRPAVAAQIVLVDVENAARIAAVRLPADLAGSIVGATLGP